MPPAAIDVPLAARQVAAQELAWGLKFSATATLDIEELPNGINAALRDGYVRVLQLAPPVAEPYLLGAGARVGHLRG